MQSQANCPQCGAPIGTGQPGLPVVTCPYCHALLSKSGDELSAVGDAGEVPFDISPLQIGTRLTVNGTRGEIVGRERWAFDRGFWNEWLLQYPNGSTNWVAEEAGQFMVMDEIEVSSSEVEELHGIGSSPWSKIGQNVYIAGSTYTVSDVKQIRCVAVEGSLPHIISADFARQSIDLRTRDKRVLTFQSDGHGVTLWKGSYFHLADLDPVGLRTFEHWPRPDFEAAN